MENQYKLNQEIDNSPITFKDILDKILRAKWWLVISVLITFSISLYVTYSTPPVYQSKTSLMIETSNRAQKIFNFGVDDDVRISDQIAVIKSRTIAEDVVEELWNSNKRNRLYLFGTKVFMPKGQRLRRPIKKIFSFGQWNPEKNQPPEYTEPFSYEVGLRFYNNVTNSLNVYNNKGTNIIQIAATSPHPYEAALIANTVAEIYQRRDKEWSSNESTNLKSFLEKRLTNKEQEIEEVEEKISDYKKKNKIYDLEGNIENLLENRTLIESKYDAIDVDIAVIKRQKILLSEKLDSLEIVIPNQILSSINAQLEALRLQVGEKESELIKNATIYGESHEAVVKIKINIKNLKEQLRDKTNELIETGLSVIDPINYRQDLITSLIAFETDLHQLNAKSEQYQELITKYDEEIELLPEKQSYLGKLEREKEVLSNTYAYIRQKIEEARVSMASEPGKVRIINRAEQSSSPISPDIAKNLIMSIFFGLFLGLVISISIEYFDNTLRSIDFIEKKKLPVLAIIPSIGNSLMNKTFNISNKGKNRVRKNSKIRIGVGDLQRRLVTHEDPKSPVSEAYRGLRTSLMYTKKGSKKTIMVSSPGPGEGKTTTIINLAITYANLGKKTLLIDGDLRKPVLHKVFNGDQNKGLTHFLSGMEEKWSNVVQKTNIENLNIIYSGVIPPNPSELLGSEIMKTLVEEIKDEFDIILFDAPPVMAVTDAVVLARLIDQFILVVRFGSTDKDSINYTLTSLSNVNTPILGVVMNDLNTSNSYYSGYYYRYHQYYYTSENKS